MARQGDDEVWLAVAGAALIGTFVALIYAQGMDAAESGGVSPRRLGAWSISGWLMFGCGVFLIGSAIAAEQTEGEALFRLVVGGCLVVTALIVAAAIAPWRSSVERLLWGIVFWFALLVPGYVLASAVMWFGWTVLWFDEPCREVSTTWEGVGCAWEVAFVPLMVAVVIASIAVAIGVKWVHARQANAREHLDHGS